jgi:hypothetical protein
MRWYKEGIHDSEYADIRSHYVDVEAWHPLDHFKSRICKGPQVCPSWFIDRWFSSL